MALDRDRLFRLLLAHRGMLLGYILAIVRDFHLAEDVFQDASLVILKKGLSLDGEEGFPAWARTVARFEALRALREKNRTPGVLEPAVLDLLEQQPQDEGGPDDYRLALQECMEKLSPKAQRLIELRYVAGMRGNVIADRLQQPPNTIYVALSRIYRVLATCVKERLSFQG